MHRHRITRGDSMGYCLEYKSGNDKDSLLGKRIRVAALTMVSTLVFVSMVNLFWPRGSRFLEEFLFNENSTVAAAAMDCFAADLESGMAFGEAVELFISKLRES